MAKVAGAAVEGLETVATVARFVGYTVAVASFAVDAYGASKGSEAGRINVVIDGVAIVGATIVGGSGAGIILGVASAATLVVTMSME